MYDVFASDYYFFSNDVSFLFETKNKDGLLKLIKHKHCEELKDNIPIITKRNDLLMWNVVFARGIIKKGTTKQYLHTIYNKFYKAILLANTIDALQKLELDIATAYIDILLDFVEVTDNLIINKIIGYLYVNIESSSTLADIAKALNSSVGYLSSCFKKTTGVSIMEYFKKIKIDRAKALLVSTEKSILEISTLLGFCDQANFSRNFKKIVGVTPTKYRNDLSWQKS